MQYGITKDFKQQVKCNQVFYCILQKLSQFLGLQGLHDFFQMYQRVRAKSKQNIDAQQNSKQNIDNQQKSKQKTVNRSIK